MLKGRLGLETARIPHVDRHGLTYLARGKLYVQNGTLRFVTIGEGELAKGDYAIPFQMVSTILLGPGGSVTHDALRLLARHGTGLLVVGQGGVRLYSAMPFGPNDSALARRQVRAWSDCDGARIHVARRMYAWRLGEIVPHSEISVLRGIEGSRMKETYRTLAQQFDIEWKGRRYDRKRPDAADLPNQAINHAASAVEGAAQIAVASTGTIAQLGFIHEDSSNAFCLDIADLFRDSVTIPSAFAAVNAVQRPGGDTIDRAVRRIIARNLKKHKIIPKMIDRIKECFRVDDSRDNA